MNSFQILEIFTIVVIISLQFRIFINTLNNIKKFKSIFPNVDFFYINKIKIKPEILKLHPRDILANLNSYLEESEPKVLEEELINENGILIRPAYYEIDNRVEVDLISYNSD